MNQKQSKGITLIETIVLSLIFAILCSVVLPLIGRSLDEGKKVSDLSNLRQLGKAFSLYSSDYDAVQYDIDVLVASGHAPKAVLTSTKDGFSKGVARQIRRMIDTSKWRQREDAKKGIDRSFHRSFASLNDFGYDAPQAIKMIAGEPRFGWCINPSYITGVDSAEMQHWKGYYQRLLPDGSVMTSQVKQFSVDGGTLTTPLSLFADVGDKWLRNFMDN